MSKFNKASQNQPKKPTAENPAAVSLFNEISDSDEPDIATMGIYSSILLFQ